MDIVDSATRSRMMSAIRGKDTKPELIVRRFLHRSGLRFRLHVRSLPGRPDIVLPKHRTVVNVHGCFWHQHPGCRYAYRPKSREMFWSAKLDRNRARDTETSAQLRSLGWSVHTVWECEVGDEERLARLVTAIRRGVR